MEARTFKLSMVIPTYTLSKELEELALFCAESYRDKVDELIIVEDGGMYSDELRQLADVYVYTKENKGFTRNVNTGWKLSTGEYTAIVNSDTKLFEGDIRELCIPGKVTSPEIVNQYIPRLAGPFWVTPREIAKERGYLVEDMRTYCSDSEYDNRVQDIIQKVYDVKVYHEMAQTVRKAGVEGGEEQAKDNVAYELWKQKSA